MTSFDESIRTKSSSRYQFGRGRERVGLAPIEMVLVVPMLMGLMGLIMVFGFNACWKIRSEHVSRDVTWRSRHPHAREWNANVGVRVPEWPAEGGPTETATTGTSEAGSVQSLEDDAILQAPIIRGQLPVINVRSERLNFARGIQNGNARIVRQPTILPRLGNIDFATQNLLMHDQFSAFEMGIGNFTRRFRVLYETELDFVNQSGGMVSAYNEINALREPDCLALDEDAEFFNRNGNSWCDVPNFHPRVGSFDRLDKEWVRTNRVEPLIENALPLVPVRMGQATIGLYREWQEEAFLAGNQAEFDRLEDKIAALEQWVERVRP